jgi:hypothetical protein
MLAAIGKLIAPASHTRPNRVSQLVENGSQKLFMKVQRIKTLPKKLRIMLGRRKRSGRFDWPVEELMNTVMAAERGIHGVRVVGFGTVKPRFGMIQEFVLLTEYLDGYLNGLQWLQKHPEKVELFVKQCMELIVRMNNDGFTHLDLWIANLMVPVNTDDAFRVIDMENVFTCKSAFNSETLGFQLGFLYRKELNRFIDEPRYDILIANFLQDRDDIDLQAFQSIYAPSKHGKYSHKKRRKVFLEGKLQHG